MAATAKAWGVRPSSYLPELSTAEAFMLDEACAYVMGVEQQRIMDEERGRLGLPGVGRSDTPLTMGKKYEGLMDPRFKARG